MDILACKVGMYVRAKKAVSSEIKKGDIVKIINIDIDPTNVQEGGYLYFNNSVGISSEHFEPRNKFKVGDEVVYKKSYKAEVFGVADKEDVYNEYYAISYTTADGFWFNTTVDEDALSKPLNKNKLEAGDVCKRKNGDKLEILCRANDEYSNEITYFVKSLEGDFKGFTYVLLAEAIEEIIYE
jgi:hypothetical protein